MAQLLNSLHDILHSILIEPAQELFFSRNDSEDIRMGDIVVKNREQWNEKIDIAILGVPQDEGVKRNRGREGARKAPTEIRRALYKLTPFLPATPDIKRISSLRILDIGDIRLGATLEETHDRLETAVAALSENGIFPIVLGGGHDISYPNFRGFSRQTQRVGVVNIDTHLDYRPPVLTEQGLMRHSGTSFRLMLDEAEPKLLPQNMVEFGIQPFANVEAHFNALCERGATIMMLDKVREKGMKTAFTEALRIAEQGTERIMVSFDMDAVRSSDAPGVSAPSPTGLFAEEILEAAFQAGKNRLVRLIDIVEVNPEYDADGRTAKLAALVVMHLLAGYCQR